MLFRQKLSYQTNKSSVLKYYNTHLQQFDLQGEEFSIDKYTAKV